MKINKLGLFGMLLTGYFILAVIAVHLLHPELGFVKSSLSRYGIVKYGTIIKIGLYCISLSQIIIALKIGKTYKMNSGSLLMILAGLGGMVAGFFPMDPGLNRTITGLTHITGALVQFALFPIAVSIIGFKVFRGRTGIYTRITGLMSLAMFFLVFAFYFFIKGVEVFGLIQKIDIALIAGWSFIIHYLIRDWKNEDHISTAANSLKTSSPGNGC